MSLADPNFPSSVFFDVVSTTLQHAQAEDLEKLQNVNAVIVIILTSKDKKAEWYIDLKHKPTCGKGCPEMHDLTLEMDDADFKFISDGQSPQALFAKGKIKMRGNMSVALKSMFIFPALNQMKVSPTTVGRVSQTVDKVADVAEKIKSKI